MDHPTINQLISEKNLALAIGTSRSTLYGLRRKGCPWISLGGKAFYFEPHFMEWILTNQKRGSDPWAESTPEDASTSSADTSTRHNKVI